MDEAPDKDLNFNEKTFLILHKQLLKLPDVAQLNWFVMDT